MKPETPSERQVQRAILKMAGICFPRVLIFHVPNGAFLAGNEADRKRQMGILLGDGLKPGMPDLTCLWNHGCAFIEVKRPGSEGRISDAQEQMHAQLESYGWHVAVVTSASQAFDFLKAEGAPTNIGEWRE